MRKATTVGQHAANGQVIFRARRRKGLTQTQLGDAAGITYRQIIRLENGEHLPSGPVRDRIAEVLELERLSIESGDDDPQEAALSGDPFRGGARDGAAADGETDGRRAARRRGPVTKEAA